MAAAKPVVLTDDEKTALAHTWSHVAQVIRDPVTGIAHLRTSWAGGGGHGWHYSTHEPRGKITVTRHEFLPDVLTDCPEWCDDERFSHTPEGRHIQQWRDGELLFECQVSFKRLQAWAEQLPPAAGEELRAASDTATARALTCALINGDHPALPGQQGMLW